MTLRKLWAFIKLTRPVFLLGGALLYALGIAMAASQGVVIDLRRALLGQLIVTSIQLMAHYANEYYDLEVDRLIAHNRTFFSGGSGVLPSGELPRQVARRAMAACATVAIIGICVAAVQSPLMLVVGLTSLLGSWYYSAPPLALMGSGWGELTTSIIVALMVPLAGFVLQANRIDPIVLAICLPLAPIHMAMMITFEFPDFEADRAAGKRTLAVRLGKDRVAQLHNGLLAAAFMFNLVMVISHGPWPAARFVWLAMPLAAWQIIGVEWRARHIWTDPSLLALGGVGLFALTAGLWLIGFVGWPA